MRHTKVTRALWWLTGALWVASVVSAVWFALPPYAEAPVLVLILRSPAVVGAAATLSVVLMMWQLLTPLSTVARVMFESGGRAGCPEHGPQPEPRAVGESVVIAMPRPRH